VVGGEGPRGGAAVDRLEDGRLHLDEAALVEDAAHGGDQARAGAEGLAALAVDDQVEIALAVALLDIAQPGPLLGGRVDRLGQDADRSDKDRALALLGQAQHALHLDDIEAVEVVAEAGELLVAELGAADPELDRAGAVIDVGEGDLAHHAAGAHDPPGQGQAGLARGKGIELLQRGGDAVAARAARRVWVQASRAQPLKLGLALGL